MTDEKSSTEPTSSQANGGYPAPTVPLRRIPTLDEAMAAELIALRYNSDERTHRSHLGNMLVAYFVQGEDASILQGEFEFQAIIWDLLQQVAATTGSEIAGDVAKLAWIMRERSAAAIEIHNAFERANGRYYDERKVFEQYSARDYECRDARLANHPLTSVRAIESWLFEPEAVAQPKPTEQDAE